LRELLNSIKKNICFFILSGLVMSFALVFSQNKIFANTKKQPVRIGVLAKRGKAICLKKWTPTVAYLTKKITGYSFSIVPLGFDNYEEFIKNKKVDFVLVNPVMYVEMETKYRVTRIATLKNSRETGIYTVFGGVCFTRFSHKDIRKWKDLNGKIFMGVNKETLSYLSVKREMKRFNIKLKKMIFSNNHDAVVYAVLNRKVDVGVVRTDTLERMASEGKINLADFFILPHKNCNHDLENSDIRFLHSTDLYPEWPFAKTANTSDKLAKKVAVALLLMSEKSHAAVMAKSAGWTVPLSYQPVHDCLKVLRVGQYKDYGKLTLKQAVYKYWEMELTIFFFLMLMLFFLYYSLLNKKALKKSKKEYAVIFNNAPIGFFQYDKKGIITSLNDKSIEIVGSSRKLLEGLNLFNLSDKKFISALELSLQGNPGFYDGDYHSMTADKITAVHAIFFPMKEENGKVFGGICIVEDVSEKKIAEKKLLKTLAETEVLREKEKKANMAKSMFLATMSHEIRTPMNAILGMTDLALMTSKIEEQHSYLEIIKQSGNHLLSLINDILDYSKIEAGKMELEENNFYFRNIFSFIKKIYEIEIEKKGLKLIFDLSEDLPANIVGDELRIRQILINLISNALKFTDKGKIIVKSSVKKGVDINPEFVVIEISVSDTGIGISLDQQENIFSNFHQANMSTSRKFGGTGIGLSIVKKLVNLMNGEIQVKSFPGKGSEFIFWINVKKGLSGATENALNAKNKNIKFKKLKILLAEDNKTNILLATTILKKLGHIVSVAENGMEAIDFIKKNNFDVILMDVEMPGMDGIEATEKIRRGDCCSDKKNIPIIAMTAHAVSDVRQKAMDVGMNAYITKPINILELENTIMQIVSRKQNE